MAVLATPVLNHRFPNVTQCLLKQVTASCAGEDIVRSQLVGGEGAGRESEVCVPASSASHAAPHHLTSVCYSAPLHITLHCTEQGRIGAALGFAMFWSKSSGSLVSLNKCNLTVWGESALHRVALLLSSTAWESYSSCYLAERRGLHCPPPSPMTHGSGTPYNSCMQSFKRSWGTQLVIMREGYCLQWFLCENFRHAVDEWVHPMVIEPNQTTILITYKSWCC